MPKNDWNQLGNDIKNMIELCQEWGGTYDNTQFQVEMRFNLKKAEAKTYMEKYWK